MSHKFVGPKDKTNPLAYVPMALVGVGLVAWIFASGFQTGALEGKYTELVPGSVVQVKKAPVNVRALAEPTPELIARGKSVYDVNCASCHGKEGFGDGDKGKGLNPPPRNYHESAGWKQGKDVASMWGTLETGVPGSSMAAYKMMPEEDRMAVIHYIGRWIPDAPATTPEIIAKLPAGASSAAGGTMEDIEPTGPMVPVEWAVAKMSKPGVLAKSRQSLSEEFAKMAGAATYAANCASCHGEAGGGADAARVVTSAPYVRVATVPFTETRASWVSDAGAFSKLILEATPGRGFHGYSTLTADEVADLHSFCRALARQGK